MRARVANHYSTHPFRTVSMKLFGKSLDGSSARSGDLFGKGQVLVMRAIKGRAHPLGQLVGTQQTLRLHHAPLAVHPLGLYRVQPRALLRQKAAYDPNTFLLALLHLPVVLAHPPPNLLAYVPAGVV